MNDVLHPRCTLPSIEVLYTQDGFTPVYAASQEGHGDIIDILVRAGADVNQEMTVVSFHKCLYAL